MKTKYEFWIKKMNLDKTWEDVIEIICGFKRRHFLDTNEYGIELDTDYHNLIIALEEFVFSGDHRFDLDRLSDGSQILNHYKNGIAKIEEECRECYLKEGKSAEYIKYYAQISYLEKYVYSKMPQLIEIFWLSELGCKEYVDFKNVVERGMSIGGEEYAEYVNVIEREMKARNETEVLEDLLFARKETIIGITGIEL